MKKCILLLSLFFGLTSSAQNIVPRFVKLTLEEIKSIEKEFDWHAETILIINFITSDKTIDYWNELYKNVEPEKTQKEFVYSDCIVRNKTLKNSNVHSDEKETIRNIFFPKDKTCSAIVILNKNGDFRILNEKANQQEITDYISELNK